MITVDAAEQFVMTAIPRQVRTEAVALQSAPGRVLAEDILADRGYPPFHRVAMDGVAIRHAAWLGGGRQFTVETLHRAGDPSIALGDSRNCVEAMTGATLPEGTDCVIPYEELEITGGVARWTGTGSVEAWQNIHRKGGDCAPGDCLLGHPALIDGPKLGIAASVGKSVVKVVAVPSVAIVSTGDELVEVDETPLPHQIRRSNAHALRALLGDHGIAGAKLFHLRDSDPDRLERLGEILGGHDVMLVSGGVSKGKFDFVPAALADLRVKKVFAQVSQRPGKPLWFGLAEGGKPVFGLPGNPVSSLVCARRYVVPALAQAFGLKGPLKMHAKLARPLEFTKKLTLFAPVAVAYTASGEISATPLSHNGSGDFASLRESDGFLELPLEKDLFNAGEAGEAYPYYAWRGV